MCVRCDEIDKEIARYQWLKRKVFDPQANQAIDDLTNALEAEKRSLHAE